MKPPATSPKWWMLLSQGPGKCHGGEDLAATYGFASVTCYAGVAGTPDPQPFLGMIREDFWACQYTLL